MCTWRRLVGSSQRHCKMVSWGDGDRDGLRVSRAEVQWPSDVGKRELLVQGVASQDQMPACIRVAQENKAKGGRDGRGVSRLRFWTG